MSSVNDRQPCSALVLLGKQHVCSNGFPISGPCSGTAGVPICLQEQVCGRLFPETGKPEKCALPDGYFVTTWKQDGGEA